MKLSASPRCPVLCCEHLDVNTELICSASSRAASVRWRRRTARDSGTCSFSVSQAARQPYSCFSYIGLKIFVQVTDIQVTYDAKITIIILKKITIKKTKIYSHKFI